MLAKGVKYKIILTTFMKMNNEKIILQQRARQTLYPLGT